MTQVALIISLGFAIITPKYEPPIVTAGYRESQSKKTKPTKTT